MMKKEQVKLQAEREKQEEKEKKQEEKEKLKLAKKKKAAEVDAEVKELAGEADAALKKIPAGKPCLENLSEKAQNAVAIAGLNIGICSRCRWSSGCLACDSEKALQHWLKKEGFIEDVMAMKTIA